MSQQPEKRTVQPRSIRPHGVATRGLDLSPKSSLFEGRFGRIFRALPAADFGRDDSDSLAALALLASKMVAPPDPVTNNPDAEESGIPALFTYLGQFIDHDLTFDPASSLQRQNDPDALTDFRTPAFDLDCVYGRGIDDQPYMYEAHNAFATGNDLNGTAMGQSILDAHDLPRATTRQRAIIGDPRNDENVIVSQFQGLVHRFHNRLIADGLSFSDAQRLTRWHYQWVVTHDFLRKVVHHDVLKEILPHLDGHDRNVRTHPPRLRFYKPHECAFMPLEFSAAAYRFGHTMVRPGYQLNDAVLEPIFAFPEASIPGNPNPRGLVGFGPFPDNWAIDWSRFIDLDPRDPKGSGRLQLAYRIDSSLVQPLLKLPEPVVDGPDVMKSLAERNLVRGWRMRLPSGQSVARAMGFEPLRDAEISLGKAVEDEEPNWTPILDLKDANGRSYFEGNCPLWTYILAEAKANRHRAKLTYRGGTEAIDTPQLGPVGGTIVSETFAGIMLEDKNSFWSLDPRWQPWYEENGHTIREAFGLREFVAFALGRGSMG